MRRRTRSIRLLYLMHSDWDFIWQRPQALATHLDENSSFQLLVAYLPTWRRWKLVSNPSRVRRLLLPQLPYSRRFDMMSRMNRLLARFALWAIGLFWRPDAVLVPYPSLYAALPVRLRRLPIFYDCMDLAVGFERRVHRRGELERLERELVSHSTEVFVSSEHLGAHIAALMPPGRSPILVRNGFDERFLQQHESSNAAQTTGRIRIGYFGLISSWFDASSLLACLQRFPKLEFHLWGPSDVQLPRHPRLILHGAVPHLALRGRTASVDGLIMPFVVSELVEGVDPVKLYEYLGLGKPVFTVYYPELKHFAGLVHFYRTTEQLIALVGRLAAGDRSLERDRLRVREFLDRSSWRARAGLVAASIEGVFRRPAHDSSAADTDRAADERLTVAAGPRHR